ncbi:unnamed protein product [Ectocarpus fasciculatus]
MAGSSGFGDRKPERDVRVTRRCPDAAITNKPHRGSSTTSRESTNKGGSGASTETLSTRGNRSESDVLGTPLVRENVFLDTGSASLQNESRTAIPSTARSLSSPPLGGDDWFARPAQGDQEVHSQLEREEDEAVQYNDDDTAADGNSTKTDGGGTCTEHSSPYSSRAGHDSHGSDLSRSTRGTFDTVSDLSCSGIFPGLSAVGDQESAQDSSSVSPNLARLAASPGGDGQDSDDIEDSHITHLVQDRRRWQLRAFEAEYELASMRSFRAHLDSGGDETRGEGSRPLESTEHQDSCSATTQAPANSKEQLFSGVPPIEVDHESNGQWLSQTVDQPSSSASSSSTGRPSVEAPRSVVGVLSAANGTQVLEAGSAQSNHFAANRIGCETTSDSNDLSQHVGSDDDGGHGKFLGVVDNDDEQENNRTGSHCLLREEITHLKENLRQAELREAAAEATIASVTQRARAAEVSREVKEIQQIRNLEIRLARRTNNDNNHQKACVRWRGRQFSGGSENVDVSTNLDFSRPRHEVFPVSEEEEEHPSSPCDSVKNNHGCPPSMIPTDAHRRSPISADRTIHGPTGPDLLPAKRESARRAMRIFRQSCVDIGARATRAGGVVSAAAAAVSETAKDVAHSATAAVGGENFLGQHRGERKPADRCSGIGTDGGPVEAYWGSDYCTSM